jgi:hypothetical protein
MRWLLIFVLLVHGLIHLMGFAKAFGYAEMPQLTEAISREWGVVWLLAACLVVSTAVMLAAGARTYWIAGAVAVIVSQLLIAMAWRDAWAGTAANVLLLIVVTHGFLTEGPWSFHTKYLRDAEAGLSRRTATAAVTETDLAPLPAPVQRYLKVTHTLGQPRVTNYRINFTGRIRSAPDAAWMPFEAKQQSFADQPTRLFLMRARMFGLPVEAFHRLIDGHATMRVKAVGAVVVADERGEEMDRAESVTLFNDMCLMAPGTLVSPDIRWEPVDASSARAHFTHRGHTITATLFFDDAGHLVNFESDDRSRSGPDGSFTRHRFSTPVRNYRDFGPLHLAGYGEARWHLPDGVFTYGEFTMVDIAMNVR